MSLTYDETNSQYTFQGKICVKSGQLADVDMVITYREGDDATVVAIETKANGPVSNIFRSVVVPNLPSIIHQAFVSAGVDVDGTISEVTEQDAPVEAVAAEVVVDAVVPQPAVEVVEDALENMQPPSAFDHLAGAAVQFMQMKMMAAHEMLPQPLADMVEDNL